MITTACRNKSGQYDVYHRQRITMSKIKTRLYTQSQLVGGGELPLSREHAHFLNNVLRLKSGDYIGLFNAECGEWSARLDNLSKRGGFAQLKEQICLPSPESGPWLAFAPIKKTRTDFIVEKATELGVERLIPVFTTYTATSRVNVERLGAIATEAAEQCRRLSIPTIAEPCTLDTLIDEWPENRTMFVGDETGSGVPLADAMENTDTEDEPGFLIGPEGGFSEDELTRIRQQAFCQPIDLGPRILRAETAAISVLSMNNALKRC
jgi:16S rRNA (uracil1498-N3)-methyltransferase